MTDKYEAAEQLLLRYVRDHRNDPADAAVNWATLQRYSVTVPVARAAMWHLVAIGQLAYSWDGLLSLPDVEILDGPQPHPDFPSVCMTCGETLMETWDGRWVHAKGPKRGLAGKKLGLQA